MTDHMLAVQYLTGALEDGEKPVSIGRKFDDSGRVLSTPGNTMICHVDRDSDAYTQLVRAQDRLKAGRLASAFSFLPAPSFHMTIFEGVIDYARARERWPEHLGPEASVEAVTRDFDARLKGLGLPQAFQARPRGIFGGFSVDMTGVDAAAEADLRLARDKLRDATGIRRSTHADYGFHITLGYLLRWLTEAEAQEVAALSQAVGEALVAACAQISFGPVAFCHFDTMHHFEPRHLID